MLIASILPTNRIVHGLPCRWKALISAANAMLYNFSPRLGLMQIDSLDFINTNISHHGTMPGTPCPFARCLLWKSMTFLLPSLTSARPKAFQWLLSCAGDSEHRNIEVFKTQSLCMSSLCFYKVHKTWGKIRWRKFAHATCPLTMFQTSNSKAGLVRIEFLKAVPVGTCNEMMAWGDDPNLTPDLYDLDRSRSISKYLFHLQNNMISSQSI